ncbi:uncharacterized protein EI90DRAFT_1255082 [Cantharellus anzutake]|uniref:uncharacterized protein n=1 Tax=Cantharellus anzutake TaxID=1750568 RepID=UPI001904DD2D|nr:uncharacterized protein EI90DRAFT_1255082 [Cantharellus anzutake]KAF8329996.1 hypothetical protein EI90DRAFT_1255082 [Cantharellus anzutake]
MSLHNTPLRSDIKRLVSQAAFPPLDPREIQLNLSQGTVQPAQSQEVIEILYDVYSLTQPEVNHFIQRVGQQLRILRDSKHENIVRFLGWMLPEDTSSLRVDAVSMKYEGGEVMTFLRTQEDKSHRQKLARTLVFGVSKGLAHLHFKGIVHGNLNPVRSMPSRESLPNFVL